MFDLDFTIYFDGTSCRQPCRCISLVACRNSIIFSDEIDCVKLITISKVTKEKIS